LGNVDQSWSIYLVVALTIVGGIFSKAGSGAVFAMVPLIQRRLTGQIAGMAGAFGNVGAVLFLTVNTMVDYDQFFMIIGLVSALVLVLIAVFLEEPKGNMVEVLDDGTVEVIKLN
ncbi:MAG: MFS transporter, partial [Candidatus Thioglobus sp.]|nr:MFS transporter [Candidatus Thioglobus sp.]